MANATSQPAEIIQREPTSRRSRWISYLGLAAVLLALASGAATFLVLTGLTPLTPTQNVVATAMLVNLAFVLLLLGLIVTEASKIWIARRRRRAAARLHLRIVGLFCVVAAAPALLLALIATLTLDRGLDRWFEERTRSIIADSLSVARAYLREHSQVIRADLLAMANDIDRAAELFETDPRRFANLLTGQAILRALPGTYIIRRDGSQILAARSPRQIPYSPPPPRAFEEAEQETSVLLGEGDADIVSALVKLRRLEDAYLFVMRPVDPRVIQYLRETEEGVEEYRSMEEQRYGVQVAFGLLYLGLAFIVLLSAIWLGIGFANRLVSPIRGLIDAADKVSEGDLTVQVPTERAEGDLASLGRTFNNMTRQLRTQRDALLTANRMLDRRRRFTEAVLSGVTAGVIGIDKDGRVTLINRSALVMIGLSQPTAVGKPLSGQVPELSPLVEQAVISGERLTQGELVLVRDGKERTLSVRVTSEQSAAAEHGYVVTLDDVTELVKAQRSAAWADVARRIAHEIKNPLTPIQLSAERLRRKYGKRITEDREVFDQCTQTIIRQVGDIGRMVDEFSSFARMPKPVFEEADIAQILRETVVMMRVGHPDVTIDLSLPSQPVVSLCDRRLVSQALTNIIKNAKEAIEARPAEEEQSPGRIAVAARQIGSRLRIDVIDNGVGLPAQDRAKLLEPYITRREKGTGLGLAIVRKIMEEHGGSIELHDAPANWADGRGARVSLFLPAAPRYAGEGQGEDAEDEVAAEGDLIHAG